MMLLGDQVGEEGVTDVAGSPGWGGGGGRCRWVTRLWRGGDRCRWVTRLGWRGDRRRWVIKLGRRG